MAKDNYLSCWMMMVCAMRQSHGIFWKHSEIVKILFFLRQGLPHKICFKIRSHLTQCLGIKNFWKCYVSCEFFEHVEYFGIYLPRPADRVGGFLPWGGCVRFLVVFSTVGTSSASGCFTSRFRSNAACICSLILLIDLLYMFGGPDQDRTDYLCNAIAALSQMSYRPFLERNIGLEPTTYTLATCRSTKWANPALLLGAPAW